MSREEEEASWIVGCWVHRGPDQRPRIWENRTIMRETGGRRRAFKACLFVAFRAWNRTEARMEFVLVILALEVAKVAGEIVSKRVPSISFHFRNQYKVCRLIDSES